MDSTNYDELANKHKAKEEKIKNAVLAFLSGGLLGFMAEGLIEVFISYFQISRSDSATYMIVIFIFLASLFTGFGFFDKLVTIFRCGLIIPITGFAHSMTSSALDYKNEGLIFGIGSNIFKLAGSVILYGVMAAWLFGMIRYLLGGV